MHEQLLLGAVEQSSLADTSSLSLDQVVEARLRQHLGDIVDQPLEDRKKNYTPTARATLGKTIPLLTFQISHPDYQGVVSLTVAQANSNVYLHACELHGARYTKDDQKLARAVDNSGVALKNAQHLWAEYSFKEGADRDAGALPLQKIIRCFDWYD